MAPLENNNKKHNTTHYSGDTTYLRDLKLVCTFLASHGGGFSHQLTSHFGHTSGASSTPKREGACVDLERCLSLVLPPMPL